MTRHRSKRPPPTVEELRARGYAIVSRRHRIASRLDRDDWRQVLADGHPGGAQWVALLGDPGAADFYRRCRSKDQRVVPAAWLKLLPNSGSGPKDFLP